MKKTVYNSDELRTECETVLLGHVNSWARLHMTADCVHHFGDKTTESSSMRHGDRYVRYERMYLEQTLCIFLFALIYYRKSTEWLNT